MMNFHQLFTIGVVFLLAMEFSSRPAAAIWVAVPLEILVDEADLIVAGKVARIEDGKFAIGNRQQDVAVIEVTSVLKAPAGAGKPKQVRIAQPAAGGIAVSTDLKYRPGQQGIWLLSKHAARDVYLVNHPSQFQTSETKEKLAELIAARKKVPAGKPVGGLVARAELFTTARKAGPTYYEIRFSLKNVSDEPITVCDYVGFQPLVVQWIGPDGKEHKSGHYDWLARARLAGVMRRNFVTLLPGDIHYIGPRSKESGIYFQTPSERKNPSAAILTPGKHTITLSFHSQADGQPFGVPDVWTGTVAAEPIAITVQ